MCETCMMFASAHHDNGSKWVDESMQNADVTASRRGFLKGLACGGLLLRIGAPLPANPPASESTRASLHQVNGWVRIAPTGDIEILSNTSDIGQGTGTALAQILAEELDVEWRSVHLTMAPVEPAYFNPMWKEYGTYGSGGVRGQFAALRLAGAQARAMLISAASVTWQVKPTECGTQLGQVVHQPTGRRAGYGTLAATAARQPIPANPPLKSADEWRLIGKEVPRLDIPAKVNGSAIYGIDVDLPGLLIATIRQSPRFGGRLREVDTAPAMAVRGVRQVVRLDDAVAVVAADYWSAEGAISRLKPVWDNTAASTVSSAEYTKRLRAAVQAGGSIYVPRGSTSDQTKYDTAMRRATSHSEAVYTVPFLCHAPMEPMNATAVVSGSQATLWLPTQVQSGAIDAVARELKLPRTAVTIHTTTSGGGFGRRGELDFPVQAARIARAVGAPVKLIWSREEDMQHDFYRPAVAIRLRAGIGDDGWPVGLRCDSACESLLYYSQGGNRAAALPVDPTPVGELPSYYSLGPILFAVTTVDVGVPVGYWRSVAASQNVFAYESFFDELAHTARVDPAVWRRHLLPEGTRERRVLEAVLERAQWSTPAGAGRFRGIALARANGTVVAHVVELTVTDNREIHLHRVSTAMECGIAVNPNSVRAQIEGSIGFALSAAMYGEITVRNGAVEQANFHDYRLIRLPEMPPVDIVVLQSREPPGGVGEEAVGPFAPALVNAIFAATGQRIRDLPLARSGFKLAPPQWRT
jgi:isoquinoline 1-oxidoreductase subunit beta